MLVRLSPNKLWMRERNQPESEVCLNKTHFICASKLIAFATFSSRADQLKFCPGIQHDDECNLFTLTQRLFHVLTYVYIFLPNVR